MHPITIRHIPTVNIFFPKEFFKYSNNILNLSLMTFPFKKAKVLLVLFSLIPSFKILVILLVKSSKNSKASNVVFKYIP